LKHKWKHERRKERIKPRSKTARLWRTVRPGGADCPHEPSGPSAKVPRTVRTGKADHPACAADCPLKPTEPPEANPDKRIVRGEHTDCPPGTPRTVHPAHADRPKLCLTKTRKHNGSKAKLSKNTKNTRRTCTSRTVRHQHADCPRPTDRTENSPTLKVNPSNPSPDLPKGRSY
jgi:hypothetical protein